MNSNILLQGQTPDIVGSVARGVQTGDAMRLMRERNALNGFLQDNGAAVMAGDQNALARLAGFGRAGLETAQDVRSTNLNMDRTRQAMQIDDEKMQMARDQVAQATQDRIRQQGIEATEREVEEQGRMIAGLAGFYDRGDADGLNAEAARLGLDGVTFETFPAVAAAHPIAVEQIENQRKIAGQEDIPDSVRALEERARRGGLAPGSPEYQEFMRTEGKNDGMSLTTNPDGSVSFATGSAATGSSGGDLNELQSKNAIYATRARGALDVLSTPDGEGVLADNTASRMDRALEYVPFGVGREAQSAEYQVATSAGSEFLLAVLRKDTGAAVTPSEEILYGRLYLPQPGDGPEVLAYKAQARQRAVNAIEAGMTPEAMRATELALAKESGISIFTDEQGTAQPSGTASGQGGAASGNFANMDATAILSVDPATMSDADLAAWNARMDELGL